MILAGRWEVSNRTYEGRWTNIENPTYAAYVRRQLEYAVQRGRLRRGVSRPADGSVLRHRRATRRPAVARGFTGRLGIYNDIVRQRCRLHRRAPRSSTSTRWHVPEGSTRNIMDGQQVRLGDGIHFTFTGRKCLRAQGSGR